MTAAHRIADRYRLDEVIGAGGMGRVWRGHDERLGRDVAIKQLAPPADVMAVHQEALRERMVCEAQAAAAISHPNVARVYDIVEAGGLPWIVMEYVPSISLSTLIKTKGPFAPGYVAGVGLDVLDGLAAVHEMGVLHRDVSPHNILMARDGRVVLTDFGVAVREADCLSAMPEMMGNPQYVAPERALDGISTRAGDLWSFGATLYTAIEGRSPYARPTTVETLAALMSGPPDPARFAGPLGALLSGLLSRDPAARPDAARTRWWLREARRNKASQTSLSLVA